MILKLVALNKSTERRRVSMFPDGNEGVRLSCQNFLEDIVNSRCMGLSLKSPHTISIITGQVDGGLNTYLLQKEEIS